jgi:hypothetical protein
MAKILLNDISDCRPEQSDLEGITFMASAEKITLENGQRS